MHEKAALSADEKRGGEALVDDKATVKRNAGWGNSRRRHVVCARESNKLSMLAEMKAQRTNFLLYVRVYGDNRL